MATLLMEMWRTVGKSKLMPSQWERGILTHIYKDGAEGNTKNYRPICMLSHQRKFVEAEVAETVRMQSTPNMSQYGFQKHLVSINELADAKSLIYK